jgi:radical SAM-linked protein
MIKRIRKTGFTIAPEAGSQRLRRVINKNISDGQIVETVRNAFAMGWQVIKLYFMIGLPTEQSEDLKQLVELVQRLGKLRRPRGRRATINISAATFIPKAHTPFQWEPQISLEDARTRIEWLRERLRIPGIRFKWQDPQVSYLEGLWSRGDRRLTELLIRAHANGCRFDGWSDSFHFGRWRQAWEQCGIDPEEYVSRGRDPIETLPWDHIDSGVTKDFLLAERQKAIHEQVTEDCRLGECQGCGVCDFKQIYPRIDVRDDSRPRKPADEQHQSADGYKTIAIRYAKKGEGRFFGHLELVNIMIRALRRSRVALKFSEGFHPKPKVSFDDPLPLGMESEAEVFWAVVDEKVCCKELEKRLRQQLPPGLPLLGVRQVSGKRPRAAGDTVAYRVFLPGGRFDAAKMDAFLKSDSFWISITRRQVQDQRVDLKKVVLAIAMPAENRLLLTVKSEDGRHLRPGDIIGEIFGMNRRQVFDARVTKVAAGGGHHSYRADAKRPSEVSKEILNVQKGRDQCHRA